MKNASLIAAIFFGAVLAAPPAFAKISVIKGQQICEAAAKALDPQPQSARADRDETRATDVTITIQLKVKKADNSFVKFTCKVDRETGIATRTSTSQRRRYLFGTSNTYSSVRCVAEKLSSEIT
jgi:hypothetical protein